MKTEKEWTKEINERADKVLNEGGGKSYEAFKRMKEGVINKNDQKDNFPHQNMQEDSVGAVPKKQFQRVENNHQVYQGKSSIVKYVGYGGFWRRLASVTWDVWPTLLHKQ